MAYVPLSYLQIAGHLLDLRSGTLDAEALRHSAINRLYYAQFLRARRYLRSRATRAVNHDAVINALRSEAVTEPASEYLRALLALRNQCDYWDEVDIAVVDVELAWNLVRSLDAAMQGIW